MPKADKIVRGAFVTVFVLLMLASSSYDEYLKHNRPSHPTGNYTISQPAHGDFYFITGREHVISLSLWAGIFVVFATYGLYYLWRRPDE